MSTQFRISSPSRQRGAALIVGLLILAVVMLIGVTGMSTTVLQERMTGTQRNESLSFTGAESGLRGGEMFLWNNFGTSDGTWVATLDNVNTDPAAYNAIHPFVDSKTWVPSSVSAANIKTYGVFDYAAIANTAGGSRLDRAPLFLVERLQLASMPLEDAPQGPVGMSTMYRITSRSTGADPRVVRTTESVYMVGR